MAAGEGDEPHTDADRREISGSETVELAGAETSLPVRSPLRNTAQGESPPGSLLRNLRSGVEGLRQRIAGSGEGAVETDSDGDPVLPVGTVLGRYALQEPLGKGGMGVVYKAHDTSLNRIVALKVLSPRLSRNSQFTARFRREAQACAQLSHPNITHIYTISEDTDACQYFVMEFVDGPTLAEQVQREGPLGAEALLNVARQTARGLKTAAQSKIIHRDIKPSNLMLTQEGQVKITDFGLAKAKADMGHTLDLTSTGVVMGTPLFMSPEQGRGGKIDHRSDIYSLGATLFFLAFGVPPFEADSPVAIILKHINDPVVFPDTRELSSSLKTLLRAMMAKDVSRRPVDYDDLLATIDRLERGETLEEAPTKLVVLTPQRSTARRSLFKAGKLSVARTNLKLRRRDKAVSLLQEALGDGDPSLRCEAALLLLQLAEEERDVPETRRLCQIVYDTARDPATKTYATWKLNDLRQRDAIQALGDAIAHLEAIRDDPPDELPAVLLEQQVRQLKEQLLALEREHGSIQVVLTAPK